MALIVQKYGGTSVADAERIRNVADRIIRRAEAGDRLVVMDKARIAAEGSPRSLIEQYSSREVLELRFEDLKTPPLEGKGNGLIERSEQLPDRILLYTDAGEALAGALHEGGIRPISQLVRRSSLEDVFLRRVAEEGEAGG